MHLTLSPDDIEWRQQVTTEALRSQEFPCKALGVTLKFKMTGKKYPTPRPVAKPMNISVIPRTWRISVS